MNTTFAYREIADWVLSQIAAGSLPPGAKVPSERELAESRGVARMTARHGLRELERVGAIEVRPDGRYVAQYRPVRVHLSRSLDHTWAGEAATAHADSWAADILAAGMEPTQTIRVLTDEAGPLVAQRLEIPEGAAVTVRALERFADGRLSNLISFAFPREDTAGTPLELSPSIREGTVAWLEDKWERLTQTVETSARPPSAAEAAQLGMTGGWPLLEVWRTSRTTGSGSRPVMTSWARYPADRTVLVSVA